MPELPEVETVRRVLLKQVLNKKIINYHLIYEPIFENKEEATKLVNDYIIDIKRKGKYLIFVLTSGYLVSHLRMEGKYFYVQPKMLFMNKHIHFYLEFEDHTKLVYQDVRKFGRFHYFKEYDDCINYMNLGEDANSNSIDLDSLYKSVTKKKKEIKSVLLDQSIIAGLGNIYVDEVLYQAKVNPLRRANTITFSELLNIMKASKEILDKAIEYKGTTIRSYTSQLGVSGGYQDFLKVHTKEYCPVKHKIIKTSCNGRGTYFCPLCQTKDMKLVVGITGGIACGKTTLTNYLREIGFHVSDSDKLAKEAYLDKDILAKVKANFKEAFIDDKVDFKILSNIIFNDKNKRILLNKIIHPYVIKRLTEDIDKYNFIFLDIPLLFEANLQYLCDKVITLYTTEDIQLERIMSRDNKTKEEAMKVIAAQMSSEEKKLRSDYIIDSSYKMKDTIIEVDKILVNIIEEYYKEVY